MVNSACYGAFNASFSYNVYGYGTCSPMCSGEYQLFIEVFISSKWSSYSDDVLVEIHLQLLLKLAERGDIMDTQLENVIFLPGTKIFFFFFQS